MTEFEPNQTSIQQCRYCHRPVPNVEYDVNGQPVCDSCAQQVAKMLELNEFDAGPYTIGLLYGVAAAVLCGFIWAVIVKITHLQIGIIAAGIGFVVSRAILIGSQGRRGRIMQVTAVLLSLFGVFVGKGLIASWVLWDEIAKSQDVGHDSLLMRAIVFVMAPVLGFEAFDLVWYGIAAYEAWRLTKAIPLALRRRIDLRPQGFPSISPSSQSQPTPPPLDYAPPPPAPPPRPRSTPLPRAILITLISAAVSIYFYSKDKGLVFASGSVLCILIHELGHTLSCLYYGLPASAPIFIPYVGALISLRAQPPNAKVEAVIGIMGPVGGLLAATICYIWYRATHSPLAATLVQFNALINLFNLVPIHPLDGGRVARGVAPQFWMIFTLPVAAFCALAPKMGIRIEVAILVTVITAFGVGRTLMGRKGPYYEIPALAGWIMGFAYIGIAAILLWMWTQVRGVGSIF